MISTLPIAALGTDAGNPVLPAAAAGTGAAPLEIDGYPLPFAHLLGLAVEIVPPTAVAARPADSPRYEGAAETPAAETIALEMLFPYGIEQAAVITPPVATHSAAIPAAATPAVEAEGLARAGAAASVNAAANDGVAARDPLPAHAAAAPAPNEIPAPLTRPEPTIERETRTDGAPLLPVAVPVKADVASAPDAPSMPSTVSAAGSTSNIEAPALHARVAVPVHAAEFPREFASQVHIAVQRGVEQASIAVNPPELGPIEVRLELSNGEARLHFAADSAATREAIADAMPRLRDMLGSQGLTLSGSTVGAELPQREQPGAPRDGSGTAQARSAAETALDAAAPAATSALRLVDVFA